MPLTKSCSQCSAQYEVTPFETEFHKQMDVPAPRQCPHCRFVRRLVERNARNLHKRKCDLSGRDFISPYSDVPFPVYHPEEWISDTWDELEYGVEINWDEPFFDQLKKLSDSVPRQGQFINPGTLENSDYINCGGYLKDCYLIAETDYNEKCMYGNRIFHDVAVVDSSNVIESELCYECIDCTKCFGCRYCIDCINCSDSMFLKKCHGCKDCIGCMNLRQKQYCIFNKQYTKEQYEEQKTSMRIDKFDSIESLRKKVYDFYLSQPHRYVQMEQVENCSGDHLLRSKNAIMCVDCSDLEDCMYCARVFAVKSAVDYTSWGDTAENMYFSAACGNQAYNIRYCSNCVMNISDLTYCIDCTTSKNCFGCVAARRKEYCILNKQYSKHEFEELFSKLIAHMKKTGEWGEYFPKSFCPNFYNETIAAEYFPLSKEEATNQGYRWKEPSDSIPKVEKTIPAEKLPQSINEVPDDILNWAVKCEASGRPFKIIKQELDFYRQLNIPVPHLHPDERHNRRMTLRPSRFFYDRKCNNCSKDIQTTYSPERPEIVYCEECYLKEVY